MYKRFLVPMLLTVALTGCGHQSSDSPGDQLDTVLPVQDQITNPGPVNGSEPAKPGCPTSAEPTQSLPASPDAGAMSSPAGETTTTPAMPNTDMSTSTSTSTASDLKDAAGKLKDAAKDAAKDAVKDAVRSIK